MSNRKNLSQMNGISIKPQLSPWELKVEFVLLKERRALIDSGTPASMIKISIRTQSLYIGNKLHGMAERGSFIRPDEQDPSDSDSDTDSECHTELSAPKHPKTASSDPTPNQSHCDSPN